MITDTMLWVICMISSCFPCSTKAREKISLTELQHESNLPPYHPYTKISNQSVFSLDIYHMPKNAH